MGFNSGFKGLKWSVMARRCLTKLVAMKLIIRTVSVLVDVCMPHCLRVKVKMIYLLTAIGLDPVAVVQYTFTHKQYIEQHN